MAEGKSEGYFINGVEAKYPHLDKTYNWDDSEGRSMPCKPLAANAAYDTNFIMSEDTADALWKEMRAAYKERQKAESKWPVKFDKPFTEEDDGRLTFKASLKGAYNGEPTAAPRQVDSSNVTLAEDFQLTSGSTVNLYVTFVPYHMKTGTGVSLRLRAVQVTNYVPRKETSPFGAVEGGFVAAASDDESPFGAQATTAKVSDDDDWGDEDEASVKEPKKVVKKTVAPKEEKAEIAAVIDDWDDND
mgnify:FL=1|tara:strand:+ start:2905 stop:3639 length:735 start_codon:yes stop_codon:yes gene_type:complete